jgi:nucleotide-binding universal stress UspA family protein
MTSPSFRSILVPLDESPIARLVFATATALARDLKAQVHLLRVLTIDPQFPAAAHTKPDGLERKLVDDARTELDKWVTGVTQIAFGPLAIVIGDPWRQILEVANTLDVDLIVLGSHKYHGTDRILGTVASKVVNHANRNVLVVHDRKGIDVSEYSPLLPLT